VPQLSSTKRQWLGANFRILGIGKLARLLEFDGKAVPTWDPLRYRTFGRIEEGWVGVPTPEVNERLGPGSLVVVVKPCEPAAQCLHDFGEKELGLRILGEGQHKQSPPHDARSP
jgi:hypothetical protein